MSDLCILKLLERRRRETAKVNETIYNLTCVRLMSFLFHVEVRNGLQDARGKGNAALNQVLMWARGCDRLFQFNLSFVKKLPPVYYVEVWLLIVYTKRFTNFMP